MCGACVWFEIFLASSLIMMIFDIFAPTSSFDSLDTFRKHIGTAIWESQFLCFHYVSKFYYILSQATAYMEIIKTRES